MKKIIKKKIFSFVMLLVVLFSSVFSIINNNVVNGAIIGSSIYTDVMEDLQTDSNFNVDDYPVINNDYSIQVIAISESDDKELFVYTYEPSGNSIYNIEASSINISLDLHNEIDVDNYGLIHLSSNGVFSKYLVKDLVVKSSKLTRYYEIVSIYRYWNSAIDKPSGNDNSINEIAYAVGKTYTALTTNDGKVVYGVSTTEYLDLTGYKVGMLSYDYNATFGYLSYLDSHYIAFDVAFEIDKVYEAEIGYSTQECSEYYDAYGNKTMTRCDDKKEGLEVVLNYEQKFEETQTFLIFERTYEWLRIEKMSDFLKRENLTNETKTAIQDMQYVLRFLETEYDENIGSTTDIYTGVRVTDVSLMRLKYEVDGKTYNMGVVSNKQSDDGNPDNIVSSPEWKVRDGIEIIIALVLIVIIYFIFSPIINTFIVVVFGVFGTLWKIIKGILKTAFKLIVNILTFPFNIKGS